jgi:hypothetical protein
MAAVTGTVIYQFDKSTMPTAADEFREAQAQLSDSAIPGRFGLLLASHRR